MNDNFILKLDNSSSILCLSALAQGQGGHPLVVAAAFLAVAPNFVQFQVINMRVLKDQKQLFGYHRVVA